MLVPVYDIANCGSRHRFVANGKLVSNCNLQNLPKQFSVESKRRLRYGLMAPIGYKFVIVDFSQIEYRILCALAGQIDKLNALKQGRNIYCEFGSKLFNRDITKKDEAEYLFSKKIVLGCGYGTGKDKAAKTAQAEGFKFDRDTTDKAVNLYRAEHQFVVNFWSKCDDILRALGNGCADSLKVTEIPIKLNKGTLILPNSLWYTPELIWSVTECSWFRRTQRGKERPLDNSGAGEFLKAGFTRYWGGGLTEFICQALARVRLSDLIIKAHKELGIRPCLLVHDEYVCIVLDEAAESYLQWLIKWSSEPASWWFDGPPFSAEGRIAERYGE